MSSIDSYRHNHLGYIECSSNYDFVPFSKTRRIAIYELLDNIPATEKDFDGKKGDILIGGGGGEAPALRVSNPIAFRFFAADEDEFCNIYFDNLNEIFKAFWTPTQSYILGDGFKKIGWTPDTNLEMWLTENVCKLLISTVDKFSIHKRDGLDLSTNLSLIRDAY